MPSERWGLKFAAIALAIGAGAAVAQPSGAPSLGEVMVTANRTNAPYAQQDRPVVGLRRTADAAVMPLVIASDTRDAEARKQEIHTALLAAMDRAAASGFEIVSGTFRVEAVTRENYARLPLMPGQQIIRIDGRGDGGAADGRRIPLAAPGDSVDADGTVRILASSGRVIVRATP